MKALSLLQRWASALFAYIPSPAGALQLKPDETRHWPMPESLIDQPVAIHAAKRDTREGREFWLDVLMRQSRREIYGAAFQDLGIEKYADLPRGAIIGTVIFGRSVPTDDCDRMEIAREWGNYGRGRWAWPVLNTHSFKEPVPRIGRQGIFEWDEVPF